MSQDSNWPFADPRNVMAFTLRAVVDGAAPILLVTHDLADGAWQFLDGRDDPQPEDAVLVCLEHLYNRDRSVGELADLPLGWRAWREALDEPWQREEMEPEESKE